MRCKVEFTVNRSLLNKSIINIIKLKQKFSIKRKFVFKPVTEKIVNNIDLFQNKAAGGDIALNLLKIVPLLSCISKVLVKNEFPHPLKLSNIVPVQQERIVMIN